MPLAQFISALLSSGQIRVPCPETPFTADDWMETRNILCERSERVALGYPGPAPAVDWPVCEWALLQFYRASQALVYRDIDAETLRDNLRNPCPPAPLESKHYSVDLIFIFLPELAKLARATSPTDPLLEILQEWSSAWPLSSVGMKIQQQVDHTAFQTAPSLWQYYLERIQSRQDNLRRDYADVREGLSLLLGTHAKHFLKSN